MAYANGSASNSTDLLQQLVTFLAANGWTTDASQIEGVGWRAHLHKSGNYVHLRAREVEAAFQNHFGGTSSGIDLYLGTTYDAAQPWNNQHLGAPCGQFTAVPVGSSAYASSGPFTNYYFMTDSAVDNVVVIIEVTPGLFVYFGWGLSINKAGGFTGGPYFFGSSSGYASTQSSPGAGRYGYSSTSDCPGYPVDAFNYPTLFVRADVDSFIGQWICISTSSGPGQGFTGKYGWTSVGGLPNANFPIYNLATGSEEFGNLQTSTLDGRANLLPILVWVNRDGTTTGYSLLGSLPMCYLTNGVGNGFSNASEYTIGANTYKMFPNFAVQKVV